MRVNEKMRKALSILLCLCMLLQNAPVMAFAVTTDNLCEHHTEHTAECGYREGSAGSACTHEHSEDCYAILECLHTCGEECADGCTHECTVENGCITMELDCHHVHGGCGYSEGTAEVPCGHVHNENCGYVEAVAGTPCANAETDPECDHSGDCGYVAAVEGQPCGHTVCDDTCGYAPATEGTPCTHVCEVKVDSDDSCYKLLCSHSSGGHDDACGYAEGVSECTYVCGESHEEEPAEEPSEEPGEEPSEEPDQEPKCYCAEHCTADSINVYCDICGVQGIDACQGEGEAVTYEGTAVTLDLSNLPESGGDSWYYYGGNTIVLKEGYEFTVTGEPDDVITIDNYGTITCGTFNSSCYVVNYGTIQDGTFDCQVNNNGTITGGSFSSVDNNYGTITGGTFASIINNGTVTITNGSVVVEWCHGDPDFGEITVDGVEHRHSGFETVYKPFDDQLHYVYEHACTDNCPVNYAANAYGYDHTAAPTYEPTADGSQHVATYSCCGDVTEDHIIDENSYTANTDGTHSFTCSVCGTSVTEPHSIGADGKCVCGLAFWTVEGNTLTIDGTLGGKADATEDDLTALVNAIKGYVDSGITTIIVTGSNPAMIDMGSWTNTAIGEAIYRLSGSDDYDENYPYNGKIDLILQDVTEIVDQEFYSAWALNSITLPKVIKLGDEAFHRTWFLKTITFGSVLTEVNETGGVMFAQVGKEVGGCDLILNCGQMNESSVPAPDLTTNTWTIKFENEFKSITLTHADDAAYTDNGDGTHSYTCSSCGNPFTERHTFTDGACTGCGVIGGYCGEEGNEQNVIWTYANGTLTISGTGAMADQFDNYNNRPWEEYVDQITTIVVNDGITSIGEAAFWRFQKLTTAKLPDSLTTISQQAFYGCTALKTVNFPANLKTIEGWAFLGCALESVTLPEGLTTIGYRAFSECKNLTSVTVPASVTTIDEGAFGYSPAKITVAEDNLNYSSDEHGVLFDKDKTTLIYCRPNIEVETYTIPSTVTEICKEAFYGCKNLATITIPDGVQKIGSSAFGSCEALTTITIPAGVTTIEANTFYDCTALTAVTIPAGVTTIDMWAFSGCTALTTVTIPASVTSIAYNAFSNCSALTTVNVPCTWDGSLYTFDEGVTVNKVHNWTNGTCTVCGEPCDHKDSTHTTATDNGDGTHSFECSVCVNTVIEDHTGGTATCTEQAECQHCGASYGELADHSTSYSADGMTITYKCATCDTQTVTFTLVIPTGAVYGGALEVPHYDSSDKTYQGDYPEITLDGALLKDFVPGAKTYEVVMTWGGKTVSGEYTIAKADVGITAPTPNTLTYTGEAQYLISAGEAVGGTMVYSLTEDGEYTTSIPQGTNAGDYKVWYYVQGDANHKDSAKDSVAVTIEKATVTVTADAKSKPYGTDNPTLTYTSKGLLGDDVLTGALETTATKTSNVGEYDITVGSLTNSNYTIDFVGAKLTITKAVAPEIQWPTAAALTYGQKLSDSTLTSEDKNGTFAWQDGSIVPTVKNNGYVVVYTPKDTDNYDYTVVELTETIPVTVSKVSATVTAAPTPNTLAYTGEGQYLISAGEAVGGEMQYSTDNQTWSTTISQGTDAGKYTVYYKVVGDENHSDTAVESVEVTIDKAQAVITVDITTITVTYGETVSLPTATTNFGTVVCDKTADDLVNAGTYTVTYTVAGTENFEGATKTLTVKVEQLAVAEPTVTDTYTYTGKELTAQLTGVESYMTVVSGNKGTNAGNYEVEVTLDGNHKWADGSDGRLQWTIAKAKAEISVNTDSITVTYGETVTLPEATTNFGNVACSKKASDIVNAGTYTVTYTVAGTDNYTGDTKSITVIVNAKPITVTADALSKTYGDADPKLTYKVEGLVNGDELTGELKRVAGENVGSYTIEQNTLTAGDNYTITYTGANLTINAKAITEADVELNGSLTYTGKELTQPITVTEGITYTVIGDKATNVGTYVLTVQGTGNYTGEVKLNWSIKEAAAVVGKAPTAKELTYTGTAQALVNAGTTADGKLVYSLSENGEFTETIPTGNNASDYMVWYYVQGDDNHADSAKASVKVTIAKAKAEISVDTTPITVTYGDAVELPDATANFGEVDCDKTAAELVNAGTYTVTYTVDGTDNYDGDTKTVTVTIEKLAVAEPTVTSTHTYTKSEQTAQLADVESYMTIASGNKATNAGSYEVVITLDGNHKWADGSDGKVQWSIGKAQAQISVNTDPITVTYGETVTLPTATTNFGAVVCDKTAADLVNAGTYTVTYTVAGTDNFEGDTKSITVTVNAKAITVTAEAKSKTYGDADPKLTYTVVGLENNDTLTGELKRAAGENVGAYAIEQGTLTAGNNYTITYTGAELTITAKAITKADVALDGSLTYTGEEQTQPITVTEGITYTVTGDKATDVGTYELTVKGTDNYTGEVKLSWSIKAAAATVDTAPKANNLTYTGEALALVTAGTTEDGKLVYSLSENGTYTETIPTGTNAGDYTVWYYVQGDDNHADSAKASVKVTIAKAKAEISVDTTPITVTYGDAVELPDATANFGEVDCDKTAAELVNAGTYTVTYTVDGTDNYEGDSKTVTVTIEKLAVAEPTVSGTYTYTGKEQMVTLTGVESYMTVASGDKATNAGSYEVEITLDGNHQWADGSDGKFQWSIGKAEFGDVYVSQSGMLTYNKAAQTPNVNTDADSVGNQTATFTYRLTENESYGEMPAFTDAGTYTVYFKASAPNHKDATGSFTVMVDKAKAEITVDTDPITVTYGDTVELPDATANFGTVSCDKTAAELVNVGTYTVTYTVAGTDNYDGDTKTVTVKINPKAITEDDVQLNGSLVYTGSEQTQQITVTEGIDFEVTGNKATNVGSYTLTVTASGNYTGSVTKDWSIKAAAAIVETAPKANNLTYTGAAQALVTEGTAKGGKLVYGLTENGTYAETVPTAKNAGSYTVWYYVQGDDNHTDSAKASVKVTIAKAKAEISVVTTPITVTYGDAVKLPTATSNFGDVDCDTTAAELVNAGTYTVTYTVDGTDNYDGNTKTVTVTIEKLAVAEPTVTGTYTYTGSEQTVELAGVESYMTVTSGNKATNAGSYEVAITLDGNHKWADGSDGKVQWNIAKAKAEITVNTDPITVTYGETVKLPTATSNFGTVSCDKTANDLVNAGTYTVTYTVAGTDNYDSDTKTVTVTINAKPITSADVELNGALTYTGTEQTQAVTVKDGITYTVSGDKATDAGSYELTVSGTGNYTGDVKLSYAVARKSVTVVWENTELVYNGSDQKPTAKLAGIVTGDDVKITVSGSGKDAKSYTAMIEISGADVGNYALSGNTKAFTIAPAPVTFTVSNNAVEEGKEIAVAVTADTENVEYTVTYRQNGSTVTPSAVGAYDIFVAITDTNYRHATSANGDAIKVGVLTIYEGTKPASYTLSYTPGEGSGTMAAEAEALPGTVRILPESTFTAPKDSNDNDMLFTGWTDGEATYKAGEKYIQPNKNVVLTAVWVAEEHNISGMVMQFVSLDSDELVKRGGIVITLMLGSKQVAQAVTDENGNYSFEHCLLGTYNLIAEYEGIKQTVKAVLGHTDMTDLEIELPAGKTNTTVEVAPGTPDVVVGGLDEMMKETDETVFTEEDKQIVEAGGEVAIKMEVKENPAPTNQTELEAKAEEVSDTTQIGLYLDLDLTKTVTKTDGTETSDPITVANKLLENIIFLPGYMQGKNTYHVFREHDGVIEELPELSSVPTGTNEGFTVDRVNHTITIYAMKYSTYGIGFSEECGHQYNTNTKYTDNGDGTHSLICDQCNNAMESGKHSDTESDQDHKCDYCGAAMPKDGIQVEIPTDDTGTIIPGAPAEIDGKPIVIDWDGEIWLEDKNSKILVTYKFNEDEDPHKEYPTAMYAWYLKWTGDTCEAIRVPELDNFMTYKGTSIRVGHSSDGIRFFTAVPVDALNKVMAGTLLTGELEGYKLVEMGTLYKWAATGTELTIENGAKSYVYGGSAGSTYRQFSKEGDLSWFTGMLTDLPGDAQTLAKDILSRPYAVFQKGNDTIVLYGGSIQRSIYYVALQNKDTWATGTAYDNYVEKIISTVDAANG